MPEPTTKELASLTLELLSRVDLKGKEVPAFVAINNWLQSLATAPDIKPVEKPDAPKPQKQA